MSASGKVTALKQCFCVTISICCLAENENFTCNFLCVCSAGNTIRHDLDNIFTENVNGVTKYVN